LRRDVLHGLQRLLRVCWRQGTGPALRDWLSARGYDPQVVDFGTPLEP
jgi:hypothetical protein